MCTSIIEIARAEGMSKRGDEWFPLARAVVAYDHARQAPLGDVITLDFTNTNLDPGARAGIELTLETAGSQLYADEARTTPLSGAFTDSTEPTNDTPVAYSATTQPTISQLRNGIWVDLLATRTSKTAVTFSVDFVCVTVNYTPPVFTTAAGTVTATNGAGPTPSLAVSATYTNDADGDNTLSYRYRVSGGSYGSATPLGHSASPYSFTISGLTCGTASDVEVTYVDADGVTGTNPQTVTATPTNCTLAGPATAA